MCWWGVVDAETSCADAELYMRRESIRIMKEIKRRYAESVASSLNLASVVTGTLRCIYHEDRT